MIKRFVRRAWVLTLLACPTLVSAQTSLTPKPLVVDQYGEVTAVSIGGEEGLAYEIHLTNLNSYSVRIEEIQVLSAESLSALRVLDRDQLNENVLGLIGVALEDGDMRLLPGGRRMVAILFLTFNHRSDIPAALVHRIKFSREDGGGQPGQMVTESSPLKVDLRENPVVIGSPVSPGVWFVGNCVDAGRLGHRGSIQSRQGTPVAPQRFAVDLIKLADDGSLTTVPDPGENREFHTYGAEVLAVADGTVVGILDGVPENSPFLREMPIPMTRENMPGNHIILDIGSQRFAFYAHLQPGSLLVEVGDFVEKGQTIALLGNSGRSDAPHLHFHIAGSADLYAADGQPFVFEAFDWIGSRDLLEMVNNSDATWSPGTVPPRNCIEEMPMSDSVIRFRD